MVAELVLSFAVGIVVLVVASYIGTTMALRGFFGRQYYNPEYGPYSLSAKERSKEAGEDDQ